MAGFDKKLFTKSKKRIVKGVLSEISNENLRECDYRVTPERWVTSMFDVDENISSKVILDSRFKKDNEKTLVFDLTVSIKDYLKYKVYGKAG